MLRSALIWLGFVQPDDAQMHGHPHDHGHGSAGGHGHTHGVIDPTIATTERGIWAIKWSFVILGITAVLQFAVVVLTGSVALLADTIHNFGDAATAIPLWVAFQLVRRKPSARFTYGLGRVEDLAGVMIVAIILLSALVAGYEAIDRLINPQPITLLAWVAVAGVVGFIGNEAVAVFRIRVGREINSVALIADGYHARTDGLTSLAVVLGALGVWLGFPLADPIVGLLITLAIFGIVWQSTKAVFTRMLDGIEPELVDEIHHAAGHVSAVVRVLGVRARWLGHRLTAEVDVAVSGEATVRDAEKISAAVERQLLDHIPALSIAHVRARPDDATAFDMTGRGAQAASQAGHHHASDPVRIKGELGEGVIEIVETPGGERLRFSAARLVNGSKVTVAIERPGSRVETLVLAPLANNPSQLMSAEAPAEPHEFDARLWLQAGDRREALPFRMVEPIDHHH